MLVTPAFSGIPKKGKQNQKRLPHPCLLGGPKEGGNATSPLHYRGSPTKGSKTKSEVATSPLPSQEGGNAMSPLHSRGSPTPSTGIEILKAHTWPIPYWGWSTKAPFVGGRGPKGKNSNKNRGGRVYRGIRYIKIACVYVPLYCLYSRIITQTVCCRARRRRRRISTP